VKFLVTGGAGFIGHNVVRLLEQQGHECVVIDTCTDYGFIPKEELTYLIDNRLKRINTRIRKIDIREEIFVDTIFKTYEPDVVIHLASFPRQKVVEQNPLLASDVMSNGLINLLEKSKQYAVKKFVYISSSMVYGDFNTDVLEAHPCKPQGQYGIMKLMGDSPLLHYGASAAGEYLTAPKTRGGEDCTPMLMSWQNLKARVQVAMGNFSLLLSFLAPRLLVGKVSLVLRHLTANYGLSSCEAVLVYPISTLCFPRFVSFDVNAVWHLSSVY
jgi:hypothetical protein